MWCHKFVRNAIEYISAQEDWKPVYLCVNYFISALPFAVDERNRRRIKLPQLLQLVTESLTEGKLSGELLDFVQELKTREEEVLQAWDISAQKMSALKQES